MKSYSSGTGKSSFFIMKVCSFISSMFLLALYLAMQNWNNRKIILSFRFEKCLFLNKAIEAITAKNICIALVIVVILSCLYIQYFFGVKIYKYNIGLKIKVRIKDNITHDRANTTNYVLTNVLPIVTLEMDNAYKVLFTILLILCLGFMNIKNNLFYTNPLYDILNIKVYSGVLVRDNPKGTEKELNKVIISMENLYEFKDKVYRAVEGSDNVIITKQSKS